jgi:hypothetical protein
VLLDSFTATPYPPPPTGLPHLTPPLSSEPRRAAVALIIRVVPPPGYPTSTEPSHPLSLPEFFEQDWVNAPGARPELLFLRRGRAQSGSGSPPGSPTMDRKRKRLPSEQHVAFPGGRMEEGDEGSLYTGPCSFTLSHLVLSTDG